MGTRLALSHPCVRTRKNRSTTLGKAVGGMKQVRLSVLLISLGVTASMSPLAAQTIASAANQTYGVAQAPTAIITAPTQVEFGQSFRLDGSKSSDIPPGKVVKFIWTMVE